MNDVVKDLEIILAKKSKSKTELAKELEIPYGIFINGLSFLRTNLPKIENYINKNQDK